MWGPRREQQGPVYMPPPTLPVHGGYGASGREHHGPVCMPPPTVPFHGDYGANATNRLPNAMNGTAAMYYPQNFEGSPCSVGQEYFPPPWSVTYPVAVQWFPQTYASTAGYHMESNYHCGPPILWQNYSHPAFRVEIGANSASQTQYVDHVPSMVQPPITLAGSHRIDFQEKFIRTVPRKVFITRPAKCAWNFSNTELLTLVECCIARMLEADGNQTSVSEISTEIEAIENPRAPNGSYKGYATLTFKNPKAASLAVEALNREGNFKAKIDKDQLPEYQSPSSSSSKYSEPGRRIVQIGGIPPYYSRHLLLSVIENCIPMTYATISALGIPKYDSIVSFDFPTRKDGTTEGHASMTFSSERVADIVVWGLQAEGLSAYLQQRQTNTSRQPVLKMGPPTSTPRMVQSPPRQTQVPKSRVPRDSKPSNIRRTNATQLPPLRQEAHVVCHSPQVQHDETIQPAHVTSIYATVGRRQPSPIPRPASCIEDDHPWPYLEPAVVDGRKSV